MDSTLVQIIKEYQEYQLQSANKLEGDSLAGFILFLNSKLGKTNYNGIDFGLESWKNFNKETLTEMAVALMGKMGRFVDNYAKKSMPKTPVSSIDEFTYLIVLLQEKSMTKSGLITVNAHQITTGTEIIKRLVAKGYIEEFGDENDKRSVRVSITNKGRIAIQKTENTSKALSKIAIGDLTNDELLFLVNILRKLDTFHISVFKDSKNMEINELIEKYLL
jgi:DNA-binding MarR family transcriptional regulator